MKNRLSDLNNHLFAQIERLSDEDLTPEKIDQEAKRGEAIVAVADQIIRNASLQIQAAKLFEYRLYMRLRPPRRNTAAILGNNIAGIGQKGAADTVFNQVLRE